MSEQMKAALSRALIGALIACALTFLTTYAATDFENPRRMEIVLIAAATAGLSYFAQRGAAEGWYDTNRQITGDIKPSDVGALPPPQTEV